MGIIKKIKTIIMENILSVGGGVTIAYKVEISLSFFSSLTQLVNILKKLNSSFELVVARYFSLNFDDDESFSIDAKNSRSP